MTTNNLNKREPMSEDDWGSAYDIQLPDGSWTTIATYTTNKIREARWEAKAEELHYLTTANIYTDLMLHPDLLDKLKKRENYIRKRLKALNHRKER